MIKKGNWTFYIGFGNDEIYQIDNNTRTFNSSHQYRKYKGKLYLFYHRRHNYLKKGIVASYAMIKKYGDRDLKKEAEIEIDTRLMEAEANKEFGKQNNRNNQKSSSRDKMAKKERMVRRLQRQKTRTVLHTTDVDYIGWIHECTATNFVLRSEKTYKEVSNIEAKKDIFEVEVFYDAEFWDNYNFPTESKYLQRIKADLEAASNGKTLEEQFDDVGNKNNQSKRKYRKILEKGKK